MNRKHRPELGCIQSARMVYGLGAGQSWYETPGAYEIWQDEPLQRIKRIPKARILIENNRQGMQDQSVKVLNSGVRFTGWKLLNDNTEVWVEWVAVKVTNIDDVSSIGSYPDRYTVVFSDGTENDCTRDCLVFLADGPSVAADALAERGEFDA